MSLEHKDESFESGGSGLSSLGAPPKFFLVAFHWRFFPSVLRQWFRRRKLESQSYQSPFANHMPVEITLAVVFCLVLVIIGLPILITSRSIFGGIASFLGLAGIIAMIVNSVRTENKFRAEIGGKYSFEYFVSPVFFFFIIFGISAGLSIGFIQKSPGIAIFGIIAGIIVGYIVGIFAALGINYLGWIARFIVSFLGFFMFMMVILDLILVYGLFFK